MKGVVAALINPEWLNQNVPHVINRNGEREPIQFDKISKRIDMLIQGQIVNTKQATNYQLDPLLGISAVTVTQHMLTSHGGIDGSKTSEIDGFTETAASSMVIHHPNYAFLAARIFMSNLHKQTDSDYLFMLSRVRKFEEKSGVRLMDDIFYNFVKRHAQKIQKAFRYERDFLFDYRGCRTLADQSYLWQTKSSEGRIIFERPQHMFMRVACHLYADVDDIDSALEVYSDFMSQKKLIHATPTLFNSASRTPQLASCFLLRTKEDSLEGIYETLSRCATISKSSGGIGLSVTDVRAHGSKICGSNGISNGLGPMLRVFNETARYVDQGGGKRKGAFAIYLEPWHADIELFLKLKLAKTAPQIKCEDLNTAIWAPDLFFKRIQKNALWSLFCPTEIQNIMGYRLQDCWGDEFERKYHECEAKKLFRKQVPALELFVQMIVSMIESGEPYLLAKDSCNRKSNHQHLGCIQSSNLCTEIIEYTSPNEIAVCNLASLALSNFTYCWPIKVKHWINPIVSVTDSPIQFSTTKEFPIELVKVQDRNTQALVKMSRIGDRFFPQQNLPTNIQALIVEYLDCASGCFDFYDFSRAVRWAVRNLNRAIDINHYSLPATQLSNSKHRPIGIGIQGLADTFIMLRMGWKPIQYSQKSKDQLWMDDRALLMNQRIFETLYYYALDESCELAKKYKKRYESYPGSPVSQGILQIDMWPDPKTSVFCDWDSLRAKIKEHGVYNSLLVAPMPTQTTSHILGSSELFEPYRTLMYKVTTLKGDYIRQNHHFFRDMLELGFWNDSKVAHQIMEGLAENSWSMGGGNPNNATRWIPAVLKNIYRTIWEIPRDIYLQMAAERGPFVDQSQSFNGHHSADKLDVSSIGEYLLKAWDMGLKTLSYYTHCQQTVLTANLGKEEEKQRKPVKKAVQEKKKATPSFLDMVADVRQSEKRNPQAPPSGFNLKTESDKKECDSCGS